LIVALGLCTLAALGAEWFALMVLGDRVWWTVPLLFGPRWVMAGIWFGCLPWLLIDFRRAVLPSLGGLAIAVFAVMGFRVGIQRAAPAAGIPFRVLELNAGGSRARSADIGVTIQERHPDVVVIAECDADVAKHLADANQYQFRAGAGTTLCLLSRGEIIEWVSRDQPDFPYAGIVRAVVSTPAGPIRIGLVHLATPRGALDNYFSLRSLLRQGPNTRANVVERDQESLLARAWIVSGKELPTIVAGDFNLPVESAIYRRHWGDMRNAFSRTGVGTGYTKHTRFWGVRIDHVLASGEIGTHGSFVGGDVGSDHLPLIADLVLPVQRTSTAR
jgi:endonuclease/exonuclease/phosphatase (EEP) superfamily protein YafD